MATSSNTKKHVPNRDSLTAVNDDGSRYIIHPADAKGRFTLSRRLVAYALVLVYAALPWIEIGGYPALFLDTDAMRFHFLGMTFGSQDLWLAFFLISGLGFGLFYVTALLGRIWCGWACPQTVFLEHVYRRVERWIEGDAVKRRKLDAAGWGFERIWKRGLKHALFVFLSLALAHMFMAYFVSVPGLWNMMHEAPAENWKVFVFVFAYAAVLYFNFAWFREQLCIVICPYGRLQSALIDEHSMVIGYDEKRGEPRGKAKAADVGDCIDCNRCVQVCPTGIDIRQGLQMECIGCSACIDACDTVMDKLKRPRGLIRYDSMEGLEGRKTKYLRPRMILYTVLLLIGASVLLFSLQGLGDATITAWRAPGSSYYVDADVVRNQFMVRVTNTRNEVGNYRLALDSEQAGVQVRGVDQSFEIESNGDLVRPVVVLVDKADFKGPFSMTVRVLDDEGETLMKRPLEFIGPSLSLLK
ncbi:cytochrome c oxidase accessory protein CcoG [Pelagicoccus sp. NFK12]|uniref:Cytochrome c oxidase accessory protein CcoG n=1 Tax=Pelagicoccus enzymogenes TaxID=2773457 RepID=A0A927IKA0_9BACT|nr:cytochrome c oxidase accessory protein CcoG [Pelagicoccus enzymogenes]MBD5782400.1 cytochrome c oxidase accessory protein CcoG [Pelagicoccus enzymogenes]MDQ8200968.1 cytochrome c oxidase accessory protein CcoG [Pelagicoccus enzymogenes]